MNCKIIFSFPYYEYEVICPYSQCSTIINAILSHHNDYPNEILVSNLDAK